jgi:acyl carrier protein
LPAETHVEQGPLDRQGILDLIRDRLADILEIEPSSINEGDSADDLDADSLALIELVEALEEELGERSVGFRIEDEDPRISRLSGMRSTTSPRSWGSAHRSDAMDGNGAHPASPAHGGSRDRRAAGRSRG